MRKNDKEKEVKETKEVKEVKDFIGVIPWVVGEVYATKQDLYVWEEPGKVKKAWEKGTLGMSDEFGKMFLDKGTLVTVKSVERDEDTYWLETQYGWVCGKNPKIMYVS